MSIPSVMKGRMPMLLLIAVAATGGGCASPVVEVEVYDDRSYDYDATSLLQEASAMLGIDIVESERAPIRVELAESTGHTNGIWFQLGPCSHVVRSSYSPNILAHEIGHALGLKHEADGTNIMADAPGPNSYELNAWQEDALQDGAARLAACL